MREEELHAIEDVVTKGVGVLSHEHLPRPSSLLCRAELNVVEAEVQRLCGRQLVVVGPQLDGLARTTCVCPRMGELVEMWKSLVT